MLHALAIEDFGLIARAEIELGPGLTVFTGETGSGKTMVLGAVAFVLGERAGADVVRRGAKRALVTLTFEPPPALRVRMAQDGFPLDAGEDAILSREMTEGGKSTLRLNGRAVTAGYVRECAGSVADIIGQHEAQRLLAPAYHTEILDAFGGEQVATAARRVRDAHAAHDAAVNELRALTELEGRAQAEFEFAQFAVNEIRAASPQSGEDASLHERRRYLENIERITSALRTAHEALTGDQGASDGLGAAASALAGIASIGGELEAMSAAAAALQNESTELAVRVARALEDSEYDPAELESINARLEALGLLSKKYGGSIEAVLDSQRRYAAMAEAYESRDERRAVLQGAVDSAAATLRDAAGALTALREKAAKRIKRAVEGELPDLALPSATFGAALVPANAIAPEGAETIEFQFSANAGEPARPLAKVASGGELSRVLLALIVCVVDARERAALVFDEVDAGIGGATAGAVAQRLARLGKVTQVIVVTHLAQIASVAQRHYVLEKHENRGVTTITAREAAERGDRAQELARMLSGERAGVALEHAEELLRSAAR